MRSSWKSAIVILLGLARWRRTNKPRKHRYLTDVIDVVNAHAHAERCRRLRAPVHRLAGHRRRYRCLAERELRAPKNSQLEVAELMLLCCCCWVHAPSHSPRPASRHSTRPCGSAARGSRSRRHPRPCRHHSARPVRASFFSRLRLAQPQRGAALTGAQSTKETDEPSSQTKPPSAPVSWKPIQQPYR